MKGIRLLCAAAVICMLLAGCGENGGGKETESASAPETTAAEAVDTGAAPALQTVKNGRLTTSMYYKNTLTESAADPFILYEKEVYYLYSTGTTTIGVRTSKDLKNWSAKTTALNLSDFDWAENKCWAPEIYHYGEKYYMVFSAAKELHSIGIGVADDPRGPFRPLMNEPLLSPGYSVIDASLLFDDDGKVYLFYSKDNSTNRVNGIRTSQTYGVELSADLKSLVGSPVLIATPEQPWEYSSSSSAVNWNEGPVVLKHDGKYYLFYSAGYYKTASYSVGYAYSDKPLARYTKNDNCQILKSVGEKITGPGHCNFFRSADGTELYMCYHVHTVPPTADSGRSLCIDKVYFRDDGTVYVDGPSSIIKTFPSGKGGYHFLPAEEYSISCGESSRGSAEYLSDGIIVNAGTKELRTDGEAVVEMSFAGHGDVCVIFVYCRSGEEYSPSSCTAVINGKYIIEDIDCPSNGNPVQIILSNLPEGTQVENVKLTMGPGTGGKCYIREISVLTKDAN